MKTPVFVLKNHPDQIRNSLATQIRISWSEPVSYPMKLDVVTCYEDNKTTEEVRGGHQRDLDFVVSGGSRINKKVKH